MSPLTAPATTAEVATILPRITAPLATFTAPSQIISPVIFAPFTKTSTASIVPTTAPLTTTLPLLDTSPLTVPKISIEPAATKLPLTVSPVVISAISKSSVATFGVLLSISSTS